MRTPRANSSRRIHPPPLAPFPLEGLSFPAEERIARAGIDFDQKPWPDYPTVCSVAADYMREHVIPQNCDKARSADSLMHAVRAWDPQRDARTLCRQDGRDFITMRAAEGVKPATIRREMAIVRASVGHAVKEERLKVVPKFPMPNGSAPRMRWFTPEEVKRLMASPKPKRTHAFWTIAFGTGCRSEAIIELTWDRVDLVNRVIHFPVPGVVYKNKRRPIAPINDWLLPRLQAMRERATTDYVIGLGRTGKPSSTWEGCKQSLIAIGIDEPGVCRHVARHTFCSWRVQAGFSYAHVGALVGDTSAMIEKNYAHLSPKHLMAASNMDLSVLRVGAPA